MKIDKPITTNRINKGRIKIDIEPLQSMWSCRQIEPSQNMSGGLLIGRHIKESDDIVVDCITSPFEDDICKRHSFDRLSLKHQDELNDIWKSTNHTSTYLGEWHTRPTDLVNPSSVDIANWYQRVAKDTYDGNSLFFIVIGIKFIQIHEASYIDSELRIKLLASFEPAEHSAGSEG